MSTPPPEPEYGPDGAFTPGHIAAYRSYLQDLTANQCNHPLDAPDPECGVCRLWDDVHFAGIVEQLEETTTMTDDFDHDETPLQPPHPGERGTTAGDQLIAADSNTREVVDAIRVGVERLEEYAAQNGRRVDPAEISVGITRLVNGKIRITVTGDLERS
jgi:hypothetical protein